MAVDAQRLFATGRHHPSSALGLVGRAGAAMPMTGAEAAFSPCYGATVGSQQQHQGYLSSSPSSYMGLAKPPPPPPQASARGHQDQYTGFLPLAAVDLAKRGVRLDGSQQVIAGYKRKRDEQQSPVPVPGAASLLAAHAQQQPVVVVDRILVKHATNMWTALVEQRKKHMGLIISTVEARAAKRLKAKDEEIDRIRSMNWALEDRLRNLYVEAQMWRDMAQSNEAAANVLRGDLQRALDAQAVRAGGGDDVEDAGSGCWGDNQVANCGDDDEGEVRTPVVAPGVGRCKGCGEGAAVMMLLPCRHLCVCASCGDTARACPACGCAKNGTVCVNFS
uniref:Uncharacterized protein n=1 Tax=Avena sativa TaxID=4498 RepID=A0ACD5VA51_AVESA